MTLIISVVDLVFYLYRPCLSADLEFKKYQHTLKTSLQLIDLMVENKGLGRGSVSQGCPGWKADCPPSLGHCFTVWVCATAGLIKHSVRWTPSSALNYDADVLACAMALWLTWCENLSYGTAGWGTSSWPSQFHVSFICELRDGEKECWCMPVWASVSEVCKPSDANMVNCQLCRGQLASQSQCICVSDKLTNVC